MEERGNIVFYQAGSDEGQIEVKLEDETVWLNQSQMQALFQQTRQNISLHIKNIFNEGELEREGSVKKSLSVGKEGNRTVEKNIEYYSLDVIISVGYRVKISTRYAIQGLGEQGFKRLSHKGVCPG